MNDHIKQLAIQSGFDLKQAEGSFNGHILPKSIERFANAIVRECLDQCYNRGMNDELYAGQLRAAKYIEERFGVK